MKNRSLPKLGIIQTGSKTVQGKHFVSLLDHPEKPFRDNIYARLAPGATILTKDFAYTRYNDKTEMLYDHRSDPDESLNVVAMPEYEETFASLIQLLESRLHEANLAVIENK